MHIFVFRHKTTFTLPLKPLSFFTSLSLPPFFSIYLFLYSSFLSPSLTLPLIFILSSISPPIDPCLSLPLLIPPMSLSLFMPLFSSYPTPPNYLPFFIPLSSLPGYLSLTLRLIFPPISRYLSRFSPIFFSLCLLLFSPLSHFHSALDASLMSSSLYFTHYSLSLL